MKAILPGIVYSPVGGEILETQNPVFFEKNDS